MSRPLNILVLCTGNSARSIIGEVLINELSNSRLQAFSAGSHPAGKVNPGAIDKLNRERHSIADLESKSWDRFSASGAPEMDIVITVCDNAAGESCPIWHGSPVTVHWGIPDPAIESDDTAVVGAAFDAAYTRLRRRVESMLALPLEQMSSAELVDALEAIHQSA